MFKEGDIVVCIDYSFYNVGGVASSKCYRLYKSLSIPSGLGFYDDLGHLRYFFPKYFRLATLLEKELAE